jgi:predicted metal-binding protein
VRSLIFCTTCKWSAAEKVGPDGVTGGETLARAMEALLAERDRGDVTVERQACLWSCTRHCNIWVRDDSRFSYLAGGFEPKREAAEAILAWFDLHGASETGEVPFRSWPDGMRGHFIARLPPARDQAR